LTRVFFVHITNLIFSPMALQVVAGRFRARQNVCD